MHMAHKEAQAGADLIKLFSLSLPNQVRCVAPVSVNAPVGVNVDNNGKLSIPLL